MILTQSSGKIMQYTGNGNFKLKDPAHNSWLKIIKIPFQVSREIFFSSYYELLKISESSNIGAIICLLAFWIQILLIPFSDCFKGEWQFDQITYYLNIAFKFVSIAPAVSTLGFVSHLVMCLVFFGVLLIQLIGLIIISKKNKLQNINNRLIINCIKLLQRGGMTFLSLPYLITFVSTFSCNYSAENILVLSFASDTKCFEGLHLFEVIVAGLGFVLHVVMAGIANLWYFETSYIKELPFAQTPSILSSINFLYQIIFAVLGIWASKNGIEYLTIAVLCFVSLVITYAYVFKNPFYSTTIATLNSTCSLLNTWSIFMLLVSRIAEGNWITGSLVVWMVVLPFILYRSIRWQKNKLNLLLVTVDKVQTGDTILAHLMYLLQLIQRSKIDQECIILIEGFIENHVCNCSQVECPLTSIKKTEKRNIETSDVQINNYIDFVYKEATIKFPAHIELSIAYAFFLLEIAKRPLEALTRLENLSLMKHGFRYTFIINRYLKSVQEITIEENLIETMSRNNNYDANDVPLQSLLKKFVIQMEEASSLHIEVWGHLQEETPNLKRLLALGKSILYRLDKIGKIWQKFYKYSLNNRTKYLLCYGKFLKNVVNDLAGGDELIEEARRLTMIVMNRRSDLNFISLDQDISDIAVPMIAISCAKMNFGSIVKANRSAAIFFGYNIDEMIGQNIKKLIPRTFNMHHDAYLERSVKTKSLVFMEKARTVFSKTSNGYLAPLIINVKAIFGPQTLFYAQIRSLKNFEVCAYVLTDYKGRIETGSTGIIQLFGLTMADFEGSPSINSFFKEIFDNRERIMENGEEILDLMNLDSKMRNHISGKRIIRVSVESYQHYLMIKEYYVFKFRSEIVIPLVVQSQPIKQCEFQFIMNQHTKQLVGRLTKNKDENCEEQIYSDSFTKSKKKNKFKKENDENTFLLLTNNIKLYRLDAGKFVEIDDEQDQNEAVTKEIAEINKIEREKLKHDEDVLSQQIIKKVSEFKDHSKLLQKLSVPKTTKIYLLVVIALLFGLIVIIVVSFGWKQKLMTKAPQYQSFYINYVLVTNDLLNASQCVQRLIILNNLGKTTESEENLRSFLGFIGKNLQISISNLEIKSKDIQDQTFENFLINDKFEILKDSNVIEEMNFLASIKYMITTILILQNSPLSKFIWVEENIMARLVNTVYEEMYPKMIDTSEKIITQCNELLSDFQTSLIVQIMKGLLAIIGFGASLFYKQFVLRKINENMKLFLDVPTSKGRRYLNQCEIFSKKLENKLYDEFDMDEEEIEIEEDQNDRANIVNRKRHRNKALKISFLKSLFVKYLIAIMFVIVALIVGVVVQIYSYESIKSRNVELSLIGKMSPLYHVFLINHLSNFIRLFAIKANFTPDVDHNNSMFYSMNKYNNELDQLFINNTNESKDLYPSTIGKIRQNNLCSLLNISEYIVQPFFKPRTDECQNIFDNESTKKIVSNGISITLNVYQKILQKMDTEFHTIDMTKNLVKNSSIFDNQACINANYSNFYCAFESDLFLSGFMIQNYYVSYFSMQLLGLFNEYMITIEMPRASITEESSLIFNLFSILLLTWWLLVNEFLKNYRQLKRSERIIFIIPFENVQNSPEIRRFYQTLIDELNY